MACGSFAADPVIDPRTAMRCDPASAATVARLGRRAGGQMVVDLVKRDRGRGRNSDRLRGRPDRLTGELLELLRRLPRVAFELYSLASGGSVAARLTGNAAALDRTRAAMRRAIGL